jgi:excisionase family DNA binding protein
MTAAGGKRLNIREAARELGLKESTVRDWVWRRRIQYFKIGGAIRIDEREIEKILAESVIPALER